MEYPAVLILMTPAAKIVTDKSDKPRIKDKHNFFNIFPYSLLILSTMDS
jgi:hypothetical protein